nr:Indoleamine 2 domain containing protein [Haemonchus contortus]
MESKFPRRSKAAERRARSADNKWVNSDKNQVMVTDNVQNVLTRFRVSKELGFLLECDLSKMPENYQPWIVMCNNIADLIKSHSVRQALCSMPELTTDLLSTYEDWRLAHLLLTTMVSAYIWSEETHDETLVIPRNLSAPLVVVSEHLGLRPIICHASACLANWKLMDPSQPFSPDNLRLNAFNPLDSEGNRWFFVVTAQIEKDFGPCVYNIIRAVHFKTEDNAHYINEALSSIRDSLSKGIETMKRMPELLTPAEFYHKLRPYLQGYDANTLNSHGIVFEGMEKNGPVKCAGASAAQSSTLQLVDAFLRVEHSGEEKKFLNQQREYMPREHRELIHWVETESPVQKSTEGRQEVLDALTKFRSFHFNTVALYIITQMKGSSGTGTGGTSFVKFLNKVRADTK